MTEEETLQLAILQIPLSHDTLEKEVLKNEYKNFTIDQRIYNELPLSANESISENRSCVPMNKNNHQTYDKRHIQENQFEVDHFSDQSQSDLRIRYAFYNKGFEVVTSTKQRKYSLSHHEFYRKTMADINEYELIGDDEESSDDCLDSRLSKNVYTGSSGRDITLLPKLKIRLSHESRAQNKHSFEKSTCSEKNIIADESNKPVNIFIQNEIIDNFNTIKNDPSSRSTESPTLRKTSDRDHFDSADSRNKIPTCKKCGHKLKIHKQFSNAFV